MVSAHIQASVCGGGFQQGIVNQIWLMVSFTQKLALPKKTSKPREVCQPWGRYSLYPEPSFALSSVTGAEKRYGRERGARVAFSPKWQANERLSALVGSSSTTQKNYAKVSKNPTDEARHVQ